MKRCKITIPLLLVLAAVACRPEQAKKPERSLLIPEDKLVDVLTDTYLAGAVLDVPEVKDIWGDRDSILNYIDVIESHGLTYSQMEATMHYYFISKPRRTEKIFDKVTARLLELEDQVQKENQPGKDTLVNENLWTGKTSYALPEDFTKDPIYFDVPVTRPGRYVLKADIQVYADDNSIDPRVTVFFSQTDTTGTEVRVEWGEVKLNKNGKYQRVDMRKTLENPDMVHIKGWLLNHTSQQGQWQKHARVRNISLTLEKDTIEMEQ